MEGMRGKRKGEREDERKEGGKKGEKAMELGQSGWRTSVAVEGGRCCGYPMLEPLIPHFSHSRGE